MVIQNPLKIYENTLLLKIGCSFYYVLRTGSGALDIEKGLDSSHAYAHKWFYVYSIVSLCVDLRKLMYIANLQANMCLLLSASPRQSKRTFWRVRYPTAFGQLSVGTFVDLVRNSF